MPYSRMFGTSSHHARASAAVPRLRSIAKATNMRASHAAAASRITGDAVADIITERTGLVVDGIQTVGSSEWSSQKIYSMQSGEKFFVKTAQGRSAKDMFQGEALGLTAMHNTHTLRVPKVIEIGDMGDGSFIVMEHLKFSGSSDQAELGRQLALMHKAQPKNAKAREGYFGFDVDNTIGGTPQPNKWNSDWVAFFREQRLMHQVELTGDSQLKRMAQPVADRLEVLFEGVDVQPSVLHGDLWSGNISSVDGQPAVFDPATYYGHSEAEFGMSWCAGFSRAFYDAYFQVLRKQRGFETRRNLYTLYHYLNHFNLFGSGYMGQCRRLLEQLRSAVGA